MSQNTPRIDAGTGAFSRYKFLEDPTPEIIPKSYGGLYTRSKYAASRPSMLCRAYQAGIPGSINSPVGLTSYGKDAWIVTYMSQRLGALQFVWMPGVFEQNFDKYIPPTVEEPSDG